jgi:site-specific DNA recombinase
MTKRAALYARVSGDDRGTDGRNLAGQLEMCKEYAQQHAWEVVAELAEDDRGASGASFELPQLNRVYEMAHAGEFDVLVVREIDRLSRKLAKQLLVEEELKRAGVEIEYVLAEYDDTPEGRLNKHIRATIAEYEREKIRERMTRGRILKAKSGSLLLHGAPAPYGYRAVDNGDKKELVVYEPEARIVRLIFDWYVHGDDENGPLSMSAIAKRLTEMGVPTCTDARPGSHLNNKKRGRGKWGYTSVSHILDHEVYIGKWYYGRGRNDCHPRDEWIEVPVPSIIDHELWEPVRKRKRENKRRASRNRKYNYLLSGRLRCGMCGAPASGSNKEWKSKNSQGRIRYYRCNTAFGGKSKAEVGLYCSAPNFNADQVDAAVWGWMRSFLSVPEELANGLKQYQRELEVENAPIRERIRVVNDLVAENQAQLERLLDLYLAGNFPKEMLTDRQERLEAAIKVLQKERLSLVAHLDVHSLTDVQLQTIQAFAAEVAEGLSAVEEDFQTQSRIIEELDVQATLAIEDGQKVVYLRWLIEEYVTLPIAYTSPRCSDSSRSGALGRLW